MHKINFSKASNTLQHPAMAAGFSPIVWVQIPAYIYIYMQRIPLGVQQE
jgi:hypothetical protein